MNPMLMTILIACLILCISFALVPWESESELELKKVDYATVLITVFAFIALVAIAGIFIIAFVTKFSRI